MVKIRTKNNKNNNSYFVFFFLNSLTKTLLTGKLADFAVVGDDAQVLQGVHDRLPVLAGGLCVLVHKLNGDLAVSVLIAVGQQPQLDKVAAQEALETRQQRIVGEFPGYRLGEEKEILLTSADDEEKKKIMRLYLLCD